MATDAEGKTATADTTTPKGDIRSQNTSPNVYNFTNCTWNLNNPMDEEKYDPAPDKQQWMQVKWNKYLLNDQIKRMNVDLPTLEKNNHIGPVVPVNNISANNGFGPVAPVRNNISANNGFTPAAPVSNRISGNNGFDSLIGFTPNAHAPPPLLDCVTGKTVKELKESGFSYDDLNRMKEDFRRINFYQSNPVIRHYGGASYPGQPTSNQTGMPMGRGYQAYKFSGLTPHASRIPMNFNPDPSKVVQDRRYNSALLAAAMQYYQGQGQGMDIDKGF